MNLKTHRNYEAKARQIKQQIAKKLDYTSHHLVPISVVVQHIISNKANQARSTWRQYKAAVSYHIKNQLHKLPDSESTLREELQNSLELLANETSEGAQKRGANTSSKKQKGFKEDDIESVLLYLHDHIEDHNYANALATWIKAAKITGLRPSEWEYANFKIIDNKPILVVKNAKFDDVRANGEYRHLILSELNEDDLKKVHDMLVMLDGYQQTMSFQSLYTAVRKYMNRATRAALGKRVKYPSLYSLRHQFIADAKASGFSRQELAAMIGHATDATATKHYARKVSGKKGGVRIKPSDNEVASVRPTFNHFSFDKYHPKKTKKK